MLVANVSSSTMDPNPGPHFSGQFSQSSDYSLQPESDPDPIDSFAHAPPSHPSTYTNGGAVDPIRRDVAGSAFANVPIRHHNQTARYVPENGVTPDGSYRPSYPDSSAPSIAASPSSTSSQFAYNNVHPLSGNHYTTVPTLQTFPNPVVQQPIVQGYQSSFRPPALIDSHTGGQFNPRDLPNPGIARSPSSINGHPSDRDSFASTPVLSQHRYHHIPPFPSYDTPRISVPSSNIYSSPPGTYGHPMSSLGSPGSKHGSNGPGQDGPDCSKFPWPQLEVIGGDLISEGVTITPDIKALVEKGFFIAHEDGKWTCYRRNYFSVTCGYSLTPNVRDGSPLYLKKANGGSLEMVQAIGIRLSAAIDGNTGKAVELVLHTPKRDAGPKLKIEVTRLLPQPSGATTNGSHLLSSHALSSHPHLHGGLPGAPGMYAGGPLGSYHATGNVPTPHLPCQTVPLPTAEGNATEASPNQGNGNGAASQFSFSPNGSHMQQPGTGTSHTFERIQFKCATANNGKRRASQQYFHLIAELCVDTRKEGASQPSWNIIARRVSDKIVVRGRSPSHYQSENTRNASDRSTGQASSSRYCGMGGSSISYGTVPHGMPRSTGSYPGGSYALGMTPGFRPAHDELNDESSGSVGSGSPDHVNGGSFDAERTPDMMSDADRAGIHDTDSYTYHPTAIYEPISVHNHLPPLRNGGQPRISTDPREHTVQAFKTDFPDAVPGSQWSGNTFGRFYGYESSKNIYPDVNGGNSSYS